MAIFKVAAHTGDNNNGYIEYDTETKELGVHLNDEDVNAKVREYLTTERPLHRFTDLSYYETVSVVPTDDVESLKLSTRYPHSVPCGVARMWMFFANGENTPSAAVHNLADETSKMCITGRQAMKTSVCVNIKTA